MPPGRSWAARKPGVSSRDGSATLLGVGRSRSVATTRSCRAAPLPISLALDTTSAVEFVYACAGVAGMGDGRVGEPHFRASLSAGGHPPSCSVLLQLGAAAGRIAGVLADQGIEVSERADCPAGAAASLGCLTPTVRPAASARALACQVWPGETPRDSNRVDVASGRLACGYLDQRVSSRPVQPEVELRRRLICARSASGSVSASSAPGTVERMTSSASAASFGSSQSSTSGTSGWASPESMARL